MKNTLKLFTAAVLLSVSVLGVGLAASQGNPVLVKAEGCSNHVGNHYSMIVPTSSNSGTYEYWVCCNCNEHFLSKVEGSWTDNGTNLITDSSDNRYWTYDAVKTPMEKALQEAGFAKDDYDIDNNGKATIKGYSGGPNVIIPEGVTNINSGAFKDKDLDVVVLPSTIKKVEANAFKDSGCAVSGRGDNFVVYVNMTQKEFSKLKNNKEWNAACDESPLGWGWLDETKYAEVVYKPNWHYDDNGFPVKNK